jgi:nitroreductase
MEVIEAIHQRRAVRDFTGTVVAPDAIEFIIAAAIQAPSAVNLQPWLFTVVRDRRVLDLISHESKKHMLLGIEAGTVPSALREHLTNPDFHIFYNAPVLVLISALKSDAWAVEDASLAAENLMLAACAKSLGTCWIGFAQRWLETEEGRRCIALPEEYRPVAPIIVGHPRGEVPPVARKSANIRWIG